MNRLSIGYWLEDVVAHLGDPFLRSRGRSGRTGGESVAGVEQGPLDRFVPRLSIRGGRPVSLRNPIVDAQLPDGSRVNIVYGSDVSRRCSNFTIRELSDTPISTTQLIKWNVLSAENAAYLWTLLESDMNVWFRGETASGKTTLLRAAVCTSSQVPTARWPTTPTIVPVSCF
ncbi:MAG: ATPase, T2SS/T4P/T4SS family [Nitrososphaeria archaeon]|nr:ATPase, T2SS/T4P/T4SS family [Nitrososphaeria archaeon]